MEAYNREKRSIRQKDNLQNITTTPQENEIRDSTLHFDEIEKSNFNDNDNRDSDYSQNLDFGHISHPPSSPNEKSRQSHHHLSTKDVPDQQRKTISGERAPCCYGTTNIIPISTQSQGDTSENITIHSPHPPQPPTILNSNSSQYNNPKILDPPVQVPKLSLLQDIDNITDPSHEGNNIQDSNVVSPQDIDNITDPSHEGNNIQDSNVVSSSISNPTNEIHDPNATAIAINSDTKINDSSLLENVSIKKNRKSRKRFTLCMGRKKTRDTLNQPNTDMIEALNQEINAQELEKKEQEEPQIDGSVPHNVDNVELLNFQSPTGDERNVTPHETDLEYSKSHNTSGDNPEKDKILSHYSSSDQKERRKSTSSLGSFFPSNTTRRQSTGSMNRKLSIQVHKLKEGMVHFTRSFTTDSLLKSEILDKNPLVNTDQLLFKNDENVVDEQLPRDKPFNHESRINDTTDKKLPRDESFNTESRTNDTIDGYTKEKLSRDESFNIESRINDTTDGRTLENRDTKTGANIIQKTKDTSKEYAKKTDETSIIQKNELQPQDTPEESLDSRIRKQLEGIIREDSAVGECTDDTIYPSYIQEDELDNSPDNKNHIVSTLERDQYNKESKIDSDYNELKENDTIQSNNKEESYEESNMDSIRDCKRNKSIKLKSNQKKSNKDYNGEDTGEESNIDSFRDRERNKSIKLKSKLKGRKSLKKKYSTELIDEIESEEIEIHSNIPESTILLQETRDRESSMVSHTNELDSPQLFDTQIEGTDLRMEENKKNNEIRERSISRKSKSKLKDDQQSIKKITKLTDSIEIRNHELEINKDTVDENININSTSFQQFEKDPLLSENINKVSSSPRIHNTGEIDSMMIDNLNSSNGTLRRSLSISIPKENIVHGKRKIKRAKTVEVENTRGRSSEESVKEKSAIKKKVSVPKKVKNIDKGDEIARGRTVEPKKNSKNTGHKKEPPDSAILSKSAGPKSSSTKAQNKKDHPSKKNKSTSPKKTNESKKENASNSVLIDKSNSMMVIDPPLKKAQSMKVEDMKFLEKEIEASIEERGVSADTQNRKSDKELEINKTITVDELQNRKSDKELEINKTVDESTRTAQAIKRDLSKSILVMHDPLDTSKNIDSKKNKQSIFDNLLDIPHNKNLSEEQQKIFNQIVSTTVDDKTITKVLNETLQKILQTEEQNDDKIIKQQKKENLLKSRQKLLQKEEDKKYKIENLSKSHIQDKHVLIVNGSNSNNNSNLSKIFDENKEIDETREIEDTKRLSITSEPISTNQTTSPSGGCREDFPLPQEWIRKDSHSIKLDIPQDGTTPQFDVPTLSKSVLAPKVTSKAPEVNGMSAMFYRGTYHSKYHPADLKRDTQPALKKTFKYVQPREAREAKIAEEKRLQRLQHHSEHGKLSQKIIQEEYFHGDELDIEKEREAIKKKANEKKEIEDALAQANVVLKEKLNDLRESGVKIGGCRPGVRNIEKAPVVNTSPNKRSITTLRKSVVQEKKEILDQMHSKPITTSVHANPDVFIEVERSPRTNIKKDTLSEIPERPEMVQASRNTTPRSTAMTSRNSTPRDTARSTRVIVYQQNPNPSMFDTKRDTEQRNDRRTRPMENIDTKIEHDEKLRRKTNPGSPSRSTIISDDTRQTELLDLNKSGKTTTMKVIRKRTSVKLMPRKKKDISTNLTRASQNPDKEDNESEKNTRTRETCLVPDTSPRQLHLIMDGRE